MNPNANESPWFRVPEVWLMIALLAGTIAGSLALVGTAFAHRDELPGAAAPIAAPLPPSAATRAADDATP
jgi:hypothetical protein